ncbi:MAG: restriction endonuclease subunit S [Desulfobacula sp.]|nr:restriction endonuclease subunit S [Desulfobacula sp.]
MGNWQKTKIGQFLFERKGKYKPDDEAIAGLKRINKIDFSGNFHIASKPSRTNMILVCPGDLVISGINVSKGAIGIYSGKENITATIHYSSYTFDTEKINADYFKRFLKSPEFIKLLQEQVKGGIKTEIKPKHILPLEIDLPGIEKQTKLLSHFKSVETEDRELKKELTHQQTLLKKLRQQILQEAIEGKLTADWREQNPGVEPAGKLLAKIKVEKDQLIKEKKIKKQKPLPSISEEEKPFELPDGWVWCRVGVLLNKFSTGPFGSMLHKSDYVSNGIPLVNPANIIDETIMPSPKMMIDKETRKRLSKYVLHIGEFVIARRGNLSKCAIVTKHEEGWLCGTGSFFIQPSNFISKQFFIKVYRSLFFQHQLTVTSVGQTMANLNQKILNGSIFPLPPFQEQKAIVQKVEKLLAICDQLETQVTSNQTHAEQLMQAVLQEAFSQTTKQPK